MSEPLVRVEDLKKHYPVRRGLFRTPQVLKAVDGVSFEIGANKTVGLVGESGSGKTTTATMVLKLVQPTSGRIAIDGIDLTTASAQQNVVLRRSVQAVFQDPYSSLSPRLRVRHIIAEPLVVNTEMTKPEIEARVSEVIEQVGLPAESPNLFPHEFSGGQRQRIALARAIALRPKLIVLDEPLSALDVSIKSQVMNLLMKLQADYGVAYLLIAHDLSNVRYLSDQVGVMYLGKLVETGSSEDVFSRPLHPYTQALIAAMLPPRPRAAKAGGVVKGEIPNPINLPTGCPFHPRCPHAMPICSTVAPALTRRDGAHAVSCHLYN